MELSKRLQTVAMAVTPGNRLADVGTDHGYIPIYLVKKGVCPKAYAMDVNKGPLARADEHIRQEMLPDRIETRLSDGLSKLSPEEADTIIIAGMGGELICRILREASHFLSAGKEFILQPQSEWFKVRHLLHDFGYHIEKEWFLKEEGKYYVVIKALPSADGKKEAYPDEFQYAYGDCLLKERNPVLLEYLRKEKDKKQKILERMAIPGERKTFSEEKEVRMAGTKRQNKQDADQQDSGEKKRELRRKQLEKEIQEIRKYLKSDT